jgi:hypothetical protein
MALIEWPRDVHKAAGSGFGGRKMTFSGFNVKDLVPKDIIPKDLRQKIHDHMGKDPSTLPIVTEQFDRYNQPNLQVALDEITTKNGRTASILGIQVGVLSNLTGTALKDLIAHQSVASFVGLGGAKEGSVQYLNMQLDGGRKLACVQGGLYLVSGSPHLVLLLRQQSMMDFGGTTPIFLDVMAEDRVVAETFVKDIQRLIGKHNVYRGKLLSVDRRDNPAGSAGSTGLKFHSVASITRDKIILPDGLLKRIERQTVDVGKYSTALKNAGRRLKRGILLHGKPGTGKTLTAMYLASAMKDRTVLLVTGRGQGLIESTCHFARWLEPAMVVIEDVDLIAEDRSTRNDCNSAVLLELLNEMDGLADDVDVLFVLTTNRPEILEPALAARPGRIDQAYEVPLPDAECRRRLFELYGKGLTMRVENMESFIKRTSGASGAFISELLRKAALFAAPDGDPIVVHDRHLDEAMHEMVIVGGNLTKSLLGSRDIGFMPSELTGM